MCGISGIFEFDQARPIDREVVHRMNESLRHRGPDDEGIFVDLGIGLGHRRLSIIDVAGGHQPISNEDGTVWVMLNGEIYNYADLSQELVSQGHTFTTRSDTEAIVHLYEEHGEECFTKLRGMFAIAIWDSRKRRLLLARDRVGKKPLYYYADRNRFIFGSELKAILAADNLPRTVDPLAVCDYFSLSYIPAPRTIYRDVRKLQPAHYLVVNAAGVREVPYWRLSFSKIENRTEAEWCELIRRATLRSHESSIDERGAAGRIPERGCGFLVCRCDDEPVDGPSGDDLLDRVQRPGVSTNRSMRVEWRRNLSAITTRT